MPRTSKRATYIKKLEKRVSSLKKNYIASLSADDDVLEPDNYMYLMHMISYRKLQIATKSRYLFRSRKYRKHKGECLCDKDYLDGEDLPWLNDTEFISTCRMSRSTALVLLT